MADRLSSILSHLRTSTPATSSGLASVTEKHPDDVVITLAVRTPLCKARKGGFKDTPVEKLILEVLKGVLVRSRINPAVVDEIVVGNVLDGAAAYKARIATLAAGFPESVPASTVNRFCSSGLMAVKSIAEGIVAGSYDVGIAVGAESMSMNPDSGAPELHPDIVTAPNCKDAAMPMGWTSENVAADFNIPREKHDKYAAASFQRAEQAQKSGWFNDEIIPVKTTIKDPKTGQLTQVEITKDDGIRYGTTEVSLSKIKGAFPQWGNGSTTGGNASQITDGAAAVLLMRRSVAEQLGQPILAKYVHTVVVGLAPRIMGIGPSYAIPKLLAQLQMTTDQVDYFEINEAFASMFAYCVEKLHLDPAKVNAHGGAIAFGHPLGCTGARQVATGLSLMRKERKKILVTSSKSCL